MDNGEAIPIDFGYAFGVSTQFQFVPELVPFRLTQQFLNLMQPLNEIGYFEKTMFYVLKALRNNNHILLAMMDVFIQEPSLNWLMHIDDETETEHTWSPLMKINQAKDKLNGASSVAIMIQDLKARTLDTQEVKDKYIAYVQANSSGCNDKLNVSEQVKYLIKHATDFNLLARMYEGWQPWL